MSYNSKYTGGLEEGIRKANLIQEEGDGAKAISNNGTYNDFAGIFVMKYTGNFPFHGYTETITHKEYIP